MAVRSGALDAAGWNDYFTMPKAQQEATAQLYKDAVWAASGPSGWDATLAFLGTIMTLLGDATGVGSAYETFKAL